MERQKLLSVIQNMIKDNEDMLLNALFLDLGKSKHQARITEIYPLFTEISLAIQNLHVWMANVPCSRHLANVVDHVYLTPSPKGKVLVISPWNYPLYLSLCPVISAIAAGNRVVLKPSEISIHTSKAIYDLITKYIPEVCTCVLGGVNETQNLLRQKFDHIFFTGSTKVGRIVMEMAAKHLTPCTLELGGKCPAIIHESADLHNAARRIIFGKLLNCGQTCIAPDFVICPENLQSSLIYELQSAITEFFGQDPKNSSDYSRIINHFHFDRILSLLHDSKIVVGDVDSADRESLYIPPIVCISSESSIIMKQEIFGPILPIVSKTDFDDPLAIYVFSKNEDFIKETRKNTKSGAFVINDTIMHACSSLPFGGIGSSGMGAYHGKYGFDTFSHMRPVLHRPMGMEFMNNIRYPPYSDLKTKMVEKIVFN